MTGVRGPARAQAGFTLLELMVAVVVIVVAFFGLLLALHYGSVLNETARQLQSAHEGARRAMEAVRAYEFSFAYRCFNEDISDDPNYEGWAQQNISPLNEVYPRGEGIPPLMALTDNLGNNFVIDGLRPRSTDPDGAVGRIVFPEALQGASTVLSEQGQDPFLGILDMNGNGATNDLNVSNDYTLLPLTVLVEWEGLFGEEREVRLDTVVSTHLR